MMIKMKLALVRKILSFFAFLQASLLIVQGAEVTQPEQPLKKDYLVVLLHGIGGSQESINGLMPSITKAYKDLHTEEESNSIANKIDFLIPTAKNNEWFKVPDSLAIPKLMFDVVYRNHKATDKLEGFRNNLTELRTQVEERLQQLNLGYDHLIVGGISQGAIAALTFAFESPKPISAVIGSCGLYMPCQMNSLPHQIILTSGAKDDVIPSSVSLKTESFLHKDLKEAQKRLKANTNLNAVTFPHDAHQVSPAQLELIMTMLDKHVFSSCDSQNLQLSETGAVEEDDSSSEEEGDLEQFSPAEMEELTQKFIMTFAKFSKR